ncbi:inhibitory POU protein-like isoform X1 [Pollicipes pollicipes]|uniref:inhibitory POU protein-like isoform X1 n=2 Tax=Pollicipes pollicipes TaxID=41117 RepID=UPI001884E0D0|nr:inhibitory POU protein-like isoform X1 [Pollicipes pollicipes]
MYSPSDKMMGMKPLPQAPCFPGRYSPPATYRPVDPMRRCVNSTGNLFGGLDDNLLSRAEALADMGRHGAPPPSSLPQLRPDMVYGHPHPAMSSPHTPPGARPHQMWDMMYMGAPRAAPVPSAKPQQVGEPPRDRWMCPPYSEGLEMMDHLSGATATSMPGLGGMADNSHHPAPLHPPVYSHPINTMMTHHQVGLHDADTDPRELEAFSERFKQRRIKLGVTQADVGRALANLKLPGVGALSQSTICRFESLTLSHNNMIALKPVLQAWLEEAEAQARNKRRDPEAPSVLPSAEKKRKRTSIAAPEKRSLEAYFSVQPRPSGEKIAAIAEKLDLKKNVVRVWFCNQRQKQKRMKFAAQHH